MDQSPSPVPVINESPTRRRLGASLPRVDGLEEALRRVDEEMLTLVNASQGTLYEAAQQIFSARGKQLRAALLLTVAAAYKADFSDDLIRAAASVEMLHLGSLVHDDVMDNSTERRGVRTVNAELGVNVAIMSGDVLLAQAAQAGISISQEVGLELARAFIELCEGQTLELMDGFDLNRTPEQAMRSIALKTGALFRSACAVGALCAGAGQHEIDGAARYGARLGEAFQVIDDLLDLTSTSELVGKPVGNDVRQGVYTVPLLRAMEGGRLPEIRELLVERGRDLSVADARLVMDRLRETDMVEDTFALATEQVQEAVAAVADAPVESARDALTEFPFTYIEWARSVVLPT